MPSEMEQLGCGARFDPDIAFSYIDEKLENLLGHMQKDFEGDFTAENLGPKFGGYGSFLPSYQRSPQPKTPQTAAAQISPHAEGVRQNSTATLSVPLPLKLGTSSNIILNPKGAPAKKDLSALPAEKIPIKPLTSLGKSVNQNDQRTLKVRIKVGSVNTCKNAIYSGLGLNSASSSAGNSPEVSAGTSFVSQKTQDESPASILLDMTKFPVPGGLLVSPLSKSLLCMLRKENVALESKPAPPLKSRQQHSPMLEDASNFNTGDKKLSKGNKTESTGNGEILVELKHKNGMDLKDNRTSPLKKATETLEGKQCFSTDLKPKRLSNSVCETDNSSKGGIKAPVAYSDEAQKGVPVKKRELKKYWMEGGFSSGSVKVGSLMSTNGRDGRNLDKLEDSSSSQQKMRNLAITSSDKGALVDVKEGGKSKGNKIHASSSVKSGISTSQKDFNARVMDNHKQKVAPEVTLPENGNTKMPRSSKASSFDGKKKSKVNGPSAQKDAHKVRDKYDDNRTVPQKSAQMNLLERPLCNTPDDYNLEAVREKRVSNECPSSPKGISSGKDLPSEAPALLDEIWVSCDKCDTWRLLPYGRNKEQLPKYWLCSMLDWLPGMNSCDFSEEETTKALHALYQPLPPPPESQGHLSSDPMLSQGKKKQLKQIPTTTTSCDPVRTSNSSGNSRQEVVKSRSLNDMNHKEKLPSGGAFKENKLKSKREPDQSDYNARKKVKSEHGAVGKSSLSRSTDLQTRAPRKDMPKQSNGVKLEQKDRIPVSVKKQQGVTVMDSGSLDMKAGDDREVYAKKRKLKDWQDSQNCLETLGSSGNHPPNCKDSLKEKSEGESKKQKKSSVPLMTKEGSCEIRDDRSKKVNTTKILLSGCRNSLVDRTVEKDQQPRKQGEKLTTIDVDSNKKASGSVQSPIAPTSSYSKVSVILKKSSSQELKGSQLDSVSSSRKRASNPDKLPPTRRPAKDDAKKFVTATGNPRKSSDLDGNLKSNKSGPVFDFCDTDVGQKSVVKAKSTIKPSSSELKINRVEHNSGKDSSMQSKDKEKNSGNVSQRVRVKIPDPRHEQELDLKIPRDDHQHHEEVIGAKLTKSSDHNVGQLKSADVCSADGKAAVQQNPIKDFEGEITMKKDSSQEESRRVKSLVSSRQPMAGTIKLDEHPVDTYAHGDVPEVIKEPVIHHQNGANNSLSNTACVVKDLSSSRDISAGNSFLKEAQELKDCADRLKNTGFEFEWNEAYFQAALKYLHAASIQELSNGGSNMNGEIDHMHIYRSAAKLYETCAHEYEKRQEMVSAFLAYKCMEVAYMKLVYCKSSVSNRDLQSIFQMVPQGESPSSSASDLDNLNNQAILDKPFFSKGMDSNAGTRIVAQNRPNFASLLDFTNDVNCAMDASRKSQGAFAAANIILEEAQNKEGIVSLKRVIDFSFQDVEEFVRLVRVASEAISRQGFSGTKD